MLTLILFLIQPALADNPNDAFMQGYKNPYDSWAPTNRDGSKRHIFQPKAEEVRFERRKETRCRSVPRQTMDGQIEYVTECQEF